MRSVLFSLVLFTGAVFAAAIPVSAQVVINELMPDPAASLDKSEWIELYNSGEDDVELNGWLIDGKAILSESPVVISAGGYLAIVRDAAEFTAEFGTHEQVFQLAISLANTSDTVKLEDGRGYIDQVSYSSSKPLISWERTGPMCGSFVLNPAGSHSLLAINNGAIRECFPEDAEIFPDTEEEQVEDEDSGEPENPAGPIDPTDPADSGNDEDASGPGLTPTAAITLIISEAYPSPVTVIGESEWVELYNFGEADIDLAGWRLADLNSVISLSGIVKARGYFILNPGKVTLNNTGDTLFLLAPDGSIMDEFSYGNVRKRHSAARIMRSGNYLSEVAVTAFPTPGKKNIFEGPGVGIEEVSAAKGNSQTVGSTLPATALSAIQEAEPAGTLPGLALLASSEITGQLETERREQKIEKVQVWPAFGLSGLLGGSFFVSTSGILGKYKQWWERNGAQTSAS